MKKIWVICMIKAYLRQRRLFLYVQAKAQAIKVRIKSISKFFRRNSKT